jgi:hypothetical protein
MGFRGDLLPRMATSMVISPIGWDITPLSTVIILYYYVYIYICIIYICMYVRTYVCMRVCNVLLVLAWYGMLWFGLQSNVM